MQGPTDGPFNRTAVELAHHLRHLKHFFTPDYVSRQIAAVVVAIGHTEGARKAETARCQALTQQAFDCRDFVAARGVFGITCSLIAENVSPQRRIWHQRGSIDPKATTLQAVEELGESDPIPAHPGLHT